MTITADTDTLLRQAPMTAAAYFTEAYIYFGKRDIEPSDALIIAFVDACTQDFNNSICALSEQEQREHEEAMQVDQIYHEAKMQAEDHKHENELALDQAAHELRMQAESHRHELAIMDTPIQMDD